MTKFWAITKLKSLFCDRQHEERDMTNTELTTVKTDDRIPVRANQKVWLAGGKTHTPDSDDLVYLTPEELASAQIFAWDASTFSVMKEQQSFFGGRLIRWADDNWAWVDGTKEDKVVPRTLKKNYPNLEITYDDIEVPTTLAKVHEDLKWVLDGNYPQKKSATDTTRWYDDREPDALGRVYLPGEELPQVFLVPLGDWNTHAKDCAGPTWSAENEHFIFQKAESLGWEQGDPI